MDGLGLSWGLCGRSSEEIWALCGRSWVAVGASVGALGRLLGLIWVVLGCFVTPRWRPRRPKSGHKRPNSDPERPKSGSRQPRAAQERPRGHLGGPLGRLGRLLGRLGASYKTLWGCLGRSGTALFQHARTQAREWAVWRRVMPKSGPDPRGRAILGPNLAWEPQKKRNGHPSPFTDFYLKIYKGG